MDKTHAPGDAAEELPEPDSISTPRLPELAIPVTGIGASAGGLEVFKLLLAALPADTGMAFVFIQHLDPKHRSMLAEILARCTVMPVEEAADGMPLEANHVYVIPANVDMTLADGALRLAPRTKAPGSHMPIDRFLRAIADGCGNKAIGVILSGTGSDGSAGVQAIKAAGGVTFAQNAATAKFAVMPQAAVNTGCIDFVLPPAEIARELVRIGRHPYIADDAAAESARPEPEDGDSFGPILAILHGTTGIDFSLYREKMVKRRILRRLALRDIGGLAAYAKHLETDPGELMALQRDLLIGVTSFFRDGDSFAQLKHTVFPRLLEGKSPGEAIRVWVAGCATGEEAFSIAISLQEYMSETGRSFPVTIFATDICTAAIEKARNGVFLENIAADLTPERLNRYFVRDGDGYRIGKNLREMCVFARHNLIDDPPFSRLDLISCRNVLIYLAGVQKNILPLFHYALRPSGFLMLGAAEGVASTDLFSVVDRKHRIYGKRETARRPQVFSGSAGSRRAMAARGGVTSSQPAVWSGDDVRKEVDRILLSRYSPAGVVVDEDLEVLEIRGKASPYLTLPAGKVSFNLVKLIPDSSLFLEVEELIRQVRLSGERARLDRPALIELDGAGAGDLSLEAVPLDGGRKRSILVIFEPVRGPQPAEPVAEDSRPEMDPRDRQILKLERQLDLAKQRFLTAIEEHQSSREESQNTTEEALSANEELQSLNEELETAKEELQSSNEELVTVNSELQTTNAALSQARDFAMSIVETVRQPLLVLDSQLRIRMANRAFIRAFGTSPGKAEGQSIYLLSRGLWDSAGLREALETLLQGANSFPEFEVEQEFPRGRRTLVLGGCRINHLKMFLLAVDDVTEHKQAIQAQRRSEEHLRQAQKMEAVGRLAGGIAHDFNNLLTGILGYSSLLCDRLAGDQAAIDHVLQIQGAGERAAALTQQLLAFSRRQVLQPKVFDLNVIVADFDRMLRRLVGERIQVVLECAPDLWRVRADPGEIGRALMNLSLNARDAMPSGGTLAIETANLSVTGDGSIHDLNAGRYVSLAVRDTGVGIDAAAREHIFEPFFTTKDLGKGTGLGLATVLGIVEQSGGTIRCDSEPGTGTTFTILMPAVDERIGDGTPPATRLATAPRGTEVILLVEDEDMVRVLARRILVASGYVVHEARNGREGLSFCKAHPGPIDLLLSDVVMPEVGGRELADVVLGLRPGVKVLFMSGHTEDVILKEGVQQGAPFLQKPFTPAALAQKVRETLDASVGGASALA